MNVSSAGRSRPARWHRARRPISIVSAFALALAVGLGVGGTSASAGSSHYGGTLTIGDALETVCLDPQQDNYNPFTIESNLVDSLTWQSATDPTKFYPWLATSWQISDNAEKYVFHLRSGVTFSNGTALTSQVVKDNFLTLAKIPGAAGQPLVSGIKDITTPNASTVDIQFSQPDAAFLEASSTARLGIIAEASVKKTADQRCANGIIGSGPFVIQSRVLNQQTVLVPRKGYDWPPADSAHTGEPYLSKVIFHIIPESTNQIGALESGQVNLINEVPTQDASSLLGHGAQLFKSYQAGETVPLVINTSQAPLNDKAVRLAIRQGINRQQVSQIAYDGYYPPATGILTPPTEDYLDLASDLTYNPTQAENELTADGWKVGSGGVRYKDGKPLTVTVSYIAAPTNQSFLEVIQEQLDRIGFHFVLNPVTEGQLNADALNGHYEMMRWSNTLNDPDVLRITYATDQNDRLHLPKGNALDPLLAQQAEASNPATRRKLVDEAQQLIVGNAWSIPVFDFINLWSGSSDVHDVGFTGSGSDLWLYDTWVS